MSYLDKTKSILQAEEIVSDGLTFSVNSCKPNLNLFPGKLRVGRRSKEDQDGNDVRVEDKTNSVSRNQL